MLPIINILFLLLVLVGIFLIFKLVKGIIKTILIVMIPLALISLILGFVVFLDYQELKESLGPSTKVFLLIKDKQVITGFEIKNFSNQLAEKPIAKKDLAIYSLHYATERYDLLLNKNYRLFMINYSLFNDTLTEGFSLDSGQITIHFTKQDIEEILTQSNSAEVLTDKIATKIIDGQGLTKNRDSLILQLSESILANFEQELGGFNDIQARNFVFRILVANTLQKEGVKPVYYGFQKGEILVYPQSPFFSALKYSSLFIPKNLADALLGDTLKMPIGKTNG